MAAQLVILAAGMGRRFGGLKQLTPVGPGGEAIMDYTIFDALRSGFDEVILVIRRETEDLIRAHGDTGFGKHIKVHYVFQDLDGIPPGFDSPTDRAKPWGTTQAVLTAAPLITSPFAVANADDFYGAPAIKVLGGFLARPQPSWAMVGFAVADTLPADGAVSRGLVQASDGTLQTIDEVHTVRRHPEGAIWDAPEGPRVIPGDSLVSMNLWGFGHEVLAVLEEGFCRFLGSRPADDQECYLPMVVGEAVTAGVASVAVLPTVSQWCGITSAADLNAVRATMARLVAEGIYPDHLWPT